LETWLYRIAYNASLDRLRRKPTDPLPADDSDEANIPMPQSFVDWGPSPEGALLKAEAHVTLDTAIAALPPGLRAVFVLRDIEGLTTEATAEALGLSVAAVKVRLHRARLALRERLAGYFGRPAQREGVMA
jgi:RNA polymerase sigma-70 factor (ECF subfamily)